MTNETGMDASFDREGEDVSLGQYVLVLVAWWREIVLGAVLSAVGSGALILAIQVILPMYKSSSDVAVVRMTSNVALDKKFSTGATTDDTKRLRMRAVEATAKRAALLGLVRSGNVAQAVSERLSEQLDEKEAHPARLIEEIDAELVTVGTLSPRNTSNLIRITASADSPEKAAAIASAWAEEYVDHVNRLYRHTPSDQLDSIVAELEKTRESHDAAQKKLETFIANSNVGQLNRWIEAKHNLVVNLRDLWNDMVDVQMLTMRKAQENKTETVRLLIESREDMLSESYVTRRRLEHMLNNAMDIRSQIEKGHQTSVASNALALMMLKTEAYASSARLLSALEVNFDNVVGNNGDETDQLTDVNALIATLQDRMEKVDLDIEKYEKLLSSYITTTTTTTTTNESSLLSLDDMETQFTVEDTNNPLARLINKLEREIQLLRAESEAVSARLAVLVQNRDVHRSALETLENEIVELKLAMSAVTSEVRLASRALVPVDSAYPSTPLIAVLGGIVGLLAAVCFAFFANSQGMYPLLEQRRTARSDQNRDAG